MDTRFQIIQHYVDAHQESTDCQTGRKKTILNTMKVGDFATPLWHCKHCDTHVAELKPHRREKHQVCEVCGRMSASPTLLQSHMRIHTMTEKERKNLLCNYCGKMYSGKQTLRAHIKIHQGESVKKHKCNICGKSLASGHNLSLHSRIHLDEKPFECSYCGRRFTQRYNMKKHVRIHTGDKPYACDLCDESFNHNVSLKNHKKKVHGIDWWHKGALPVVPLPKSACRKSKRK